MEDLANIPGKERAIRGVRIAKEEKRSLFAGDFILAGKKKTTTTDLEDQRLKIKFQQTNKQTIQQEMRVFLHVKIICRPQDVIEEKTWYTVVTITTKS